MEVNSNRYWQILSGLMWVFLCSYGLLPGKANAAGLQTFDVTWSGASFQNSAVATAQITFDPSLLQNPGNTAGTTWVSQFTITVSGATTGNGVWTKTSFSSFYLKTGTIALDFTKELVGQNGWGTQLHTTQKFALENTTTGAPNSTNDFVIRCNGGTGPSLKLTSFKPVNMSTEWTLQPTFKYSNGAGVNDRVYALGEDFHGRLIVGGFFSSASHYPSRGIARFLPNGTRDNTFVVGEAIGGGSFTYVNDLIVLTDQSIVAVGDFTSYKEQPRGNLVKILSSGSIDSSFVTGLGANAMIRSIERQTDGKYLIGGEFTQYDGVPQNGLARLMANGSLDTTFNTDTGFGAASDYVDEIQLLDDGKIMIAGRFSSYDGHSTRNVARILSNGEVDSTFQSTDTLVDRLETMRILSTGKILVGGTGGGQKLFRLNANGTVDTSFSPTFTGSGVYGVLELPGGNYMVSGEISNTTGTGFSKLMVLNTDGSLDTTAFREQITPNDWVGPLFASANRSIYMGGAFSAINGHTYGHLAKLSAFTPDVWFESATGTIVEGDSKYINLIVNSTLTTPAEFEITVEADDPTILPMVYVSSRVIVYPDQTTERFYLWFNNDSEVNGSRTFRLRMRSLTPDAAVGSPDVMVITIQDDDIPGTVFLEHASGVLHEGQGGLAIKVKRYLNDPGTLSVRLRTVDSTALAGRDYQSLDVPVVFPAGVYEQTVVIGGPASLPEANPLRSFTVELYSPSVGIILGTPSVATIDVNDKDDPGSTVVSYSVPDPTNLVRIVDLALDQNGVLYGLALYSLGRPSDFASKILKFSNTGTGEVMATIPTVNSISWADTIESGPDGKIYTAGSRFILRYLPSGDLDGTWTNPIAVETLLPITIQDILPLPDGKLLVSGNIVNPIGGYLRKQVVRLMPNGTVDPTFNLGEILPTSSVDWIYDLALDPSGKILIAGDISSIQGKPRTNVARLFPNGTLDESFNASDAVISQGLSFYVNQISVTPGGKIYLAGDGRVIRLNSNGSLDPNFPLIRDSWAAARVAVQPDGKVVVSQSEMKRVNPSGGLDSSFNTYGSLAGIHDILMGPDGRIHVSGQFSTIDGHPAPCVATLLGGDGSAAGKLEWETANTARGEGIGRAAVKLRRLDSTIGSVGVHYSLVPGTAGVGSDVEALSGYHQFLPGETEHLVEFNVLNDTMLEETESVQLVLHNASGGALISNPANLNFDILDDDGSDHRHWLSRYFPLNPLDPTLWQSDSDGDGMNAFGEWMTNSNPTLSVDVKHPQPSWKLVGPLGAEQKHFGVSFYFDPAKANSRTIVERSPSLIGGLWSVIWDSSADPLRESALIESSSGQGAGWMTVRSPNSIGNQEFLRVRFQRNP